MAICLFSMLEFNSDQWGWEGLSALASCAAVRAHRTHGVIEIVARSTLSSEVKVPERSFPPDPSARLARRAATGYSPVGDQDPCVASIRVAESADKCSHRRLGLLSGCARTTSCRSENIPSHTWPHSDACRRNAERVVASTRKVTPILSFTELAEGGFTCALKATRVEGTTSPSAEATSCCGL